ncbi:Exocyst complex component exo84 like [Actinidia chinensis var. chinensis]|uniref:Exocyst complex component exo84 like n=1 Tax=Actinidia chinensis var. chinensis TaxID=1590841 RepID=A0A2R6S2J2_ACTCC|nr:Exocyst complex component exo84 like [Actinidia chinensis var. chinensis]
MEIQNSPNESKPLSPEQSSIVGSCRKNMSENASFVSNLRDHIHEFMSTPLEGHKACLKTTIQKIIAKFPTRNSSPEAVKQVVKKVESSIPSVES